MTNWEELIGITKERAFLILTALSWNNFLKKKIRKHPNWWIVSRVLLSLTSKCGQTSSIECCHWLEIDPYGFTFNKIKITADTENLSKI